MLAALLKNRRLQPVLALIALASLGSGVAASEQSATARRSTAASAPHAVSARLPRPAPESAGKPNIVFVLTDDLSMDLLPYMPQVQQLQQVGMTFNRYFVSDSLCCPSRASIFTGNFPHDTGVFSNLGRHGGFHVFHDRGDELSTFAVALQESGYRTGFMGKYLNGYLDGRGTPSDVPPGYVPPGWSEWDAAGNAYNEFDYRLNENGTLHYYGHSPGDYLTDVLADKGSGFIHSSAQAGAPFFLELSTFAPHRPYTPAPRYTDTFPGLSAPQPPNFDRLPTNAPGWLAGRAELRPDQLDTIDHAFRRRVQSVQAVDDMLARVEQALLDTGVASNTYVVFSSDNGLHTGEYRLMPGKMTAFDTDIHVPLIVAGPGIQPGTSTDALAENIDLAKTFTELGGTSLPGDGHSLVPVLRGQSPADWRNAILIEHHGPDRRQIDPDYQQADGGDPPSYEAMRTDRYLYVEYADGETEYYDLRQDPFELHNLAPLLTLGERALLHSELTGIENCHDGIDCWAAMHVEASQPALDLARARHRARVLARARARARQRRHHRHNPRHRARR